VDKQQQQQQQRVSSAAVDPLTSVVYDVSNLWRRQQFMTLAVLDDDEKLGASW